MSKRKKIITEITKLEKKLHHHQTKFLKHKQQLVELLPDQRVMLAIALFPAFVLGWKQGKEKRIGQLVKQLIKITLINAFSQLKKQLFYL
jgi:hypothetical protein